MKAPRDQHFLIDRKAIDKIAGMVDVAGKRVLEIGPGEGPLTKALLNRGATVIAIELDSGLVEDLKIRFAREIKEGTLILIHGDAVRCDIPPFEKVVANLPYSASSRITFRLLDIGFAEAVLMYQKEFGQRMIAPPGTPGVGRLSIMVQTYAKVKTMMQLSPKAFSPPPEVHSWVMKITPRSPPHPIADTDLYALIVRELFSHRRKTVRKGLKTSRDLLGTETVDRIIATLPEDLLAKRPEELSLKEFADIANAGVVQPGKALRSAKKVD